MNFIDRDKTLSELEGRDWGPPPFDSHVVTTIHRLRHKPLGQFTVEDLRICIGQNVGLEFLVPIAIEHLQGNPFVEGDNYRGDLLNAVLRIEPPFWLIHREFRHMVSQVAEQAVTRSLELTEVEVKALREAFKVFGVAEEGK